MAYTDPYSPEVNGPQSPTLGSIAGSYLNPVNYFGGIYTTIPSVWSNSKGIWSPINPNMKIVGQQFKNVFTKDGLSGNKTRQLNKVFTVNWKKIPEAVKNTFSINPFGGFRYNYEDNIEKAKQKAIRENKRFSVLSKREKRLRESFQETTGSLGEKGFFNKNANGKIHRIFSEEKFSSVLKSIETRKVNLRGSIGKSLKNYERTKKIAKNLKWAVRGAKAGSLIGAAMVAWDIGTAIATPLLNSSVQLLGNAINAFENRFMPEMGGKLQMSYLSYGAATERQRAIQGMSKAYINGRSAFGSEGAMYHQ